MTSYNTLCPHITLFSNLCLNIQKIDEQDNRGHDPKYDSYVMLSMIGTKMWAVCISTSAYYRSGYCRSELK